MALGRLPAAGALTGNTWCVLVWITQALNVIGSLLILMLMVFIGVDVAGRNLFGTPFSGVPEMVSLSILAIVFLQAPQALSLNRITRSDTLIKLLATRFPAAGRVLETFFDLLGMAVFSIIIYGTWPLLQKAWIRSEFIGAVGDFTAPVWPVKGAIVIGSVLMIVNFGMHLTTRWRAQA